MRQLPTFGGCLKPDFGGVCIRKLIQGLTNAVSGGEEVSDFVCHGR